MPKNADSGRRSRKAERSDFDKGVTVLLASAPSSRIRRDYDRGLRLLRNESIRSFATLIRALPHLRGLAGWTAIRLLERRGRRIASALVPILTLADNPIAAEASKVLANIGGARARRGCIRLLESDAPKSARYAATHALAFMRDDEAARTVVALVVDQHEDPEIRGQAAEGLDYFGREGGPHRRLAIRTALRGLGDPSPVVRFWCAFALGAMRHKPAIPTLRKLARRDKAVCPGWWRVCDEAADAIAVIEGRLPPDRTPLPRS
ncbi:HEAT repeat domain-containing protein [Anaeromyxobacter oryzae]|uniref:HEAT repeat domain-containing protein n=1 Tax=Anaeromyxobacter oryzae TaxID=2918170 RepID=UPI0020C0CBC8|nr:HEAT repeat domain-containing protein [Anaeromyxobacter oryzae]